MFIEKSDGLGAALLVDIDINLSVFLIGIGDHVFCQMFIMIFSEDGG